MSAGKMAALRDLVEPAQMWNPARSAPGEAFLYIDLSAVDQESKQVVGPREMPCIEAPSRARQLVAESDVLVSTVRPNLNAVARIPEELDGATASTGFCVLRALPTLLDPGYLFHWVKSPEFVEDMIRKATGASYPAVSDRIVFDSLLPLPSVAEQQRIAEVLDRAEALRAKRRAALAQLDTLTQAIFLELFGDPVTNPKGWPDSKLLGEVTEIVSGVTKGRALDGKKTRTVPYLAVVNVQDRALNLSTVKTIEATEEEIRRYRLQADDLLLTEGGDPDKLGRGTLWKNELPECIHQNHIFRVRLMTGELDSLFLSWLVGSRRGKRYFLQAAKQTTGIASINMKQLRGFPLLLPPVKLQQTFARRVAAVEKLKATHRASLAEMDALFASLQHRAFRGEL